MASKLTAAVQREPGVGEMRVFFPGRGFSEQQRRYSCTTLFQCAWGTSRISVLLLGTRALQTRSMIFTWLKDTPGVGNRSTDRL